MVRPVLLGLLGAVLATAAMAHVTLEVREAPVGANIKAVLRVPHGCDGSPMIALRVKIPEGVVGVKPMPKPGWNIEIKTGKYTKTHEAAEGAKVSEGVTELDWTGGKLPDGFYDEFVFRAFIANDLAPGSTVYFPAVQECEKGVHRWIEIPEPGKSLDDYPEPAAQLKITPKK
jgi:uncharacterized protein YcnI